ncbi:Ger(x)C family spore germination protein [Crassaminicella thermophila]|uniref:Ger(X)C family spore germination protein n=1 Tax=Crassaminicella thermophila TaxID=2599308 RepID=A0A5C0SIL9_CRATE|nr:Ger(x)C family spore germination protein [Crassaminicella thermophila]QEK13274.1 Ger(x)C family spore germination protein [Crassaminicella thermophila]
MHKWKIIFIGLMSIVFFTGCWDKVEIDKRAFITMFGVDKYNEQEKASDIKRNRYVITFEYANTGLIAGKVQGKPNFLMTSVGINANDIIDLINTRINKTAYFGHLKAVVIGEEFAKEEKLLREILDVIERSPSIGRKVNLMITPSLQKDVLKVNLEEQPVLGLFVRDLVKKRVSSRVADADLGYILRSLHESRAAIVPRIIPDDKGIKIAGAAVLKDFKMVGYLGEIETNALMYMLDKMKDSVVNVSVDNLIIPMEITETKTKMKVFEKDGKIITSFEVKGEGDLTQHLFEVRNQPLDNKYINKLEKALSKKIQEQIKSTYKKIQKDFGADLVQAGEYLRKHEPNTWDKVKDNWDEIFPKTEVVVHVDMKIRRVGVTQ